MRQELEQFIKEQDLFQPNDRLLLALSGGADSVALCYLLHEIKADYIIAHCNFNLRGIESDEDEQFVAEMAKKLKVKVFVKSFQTQEAVINGKKSIQMVARELRYEWFRKLKEQEGCKYIVTAHHKNDVLETLLLNITRGTGIAGLHGIKAKNNDLIRPLLFASKNQILDYLKEKKIKYREDSSNISNKYYRNRIRNKVIPELKTINPNLEETISSFIEKMGSIEEVLNEQVHHFISNNVRAEKGNFLININDLKNTSGALIKLFSVLERFNFSFSQSKQVYKSLDRQSGKIFISESHELVKDRDHLIIAPLTLEENTPLWLDEEREEILGPNFTFTIRKIDINQFVLNKNKNIAQLDYDLLTFPLEISTWARGDYFYPIGLNKKKKLSDFFIDLKISLPEKEKKMVLKSGEKIVWVIGERIDERFKITNATKKILVIELKELRRNKP